jgi:hypothetical protein
LQESKFCWLLLLLLLLCTALTTTAPIKSSVRFELCNYKIVLTPLRCSCSLLMLTVSDVHAPIHASSEAVDEPAVHSAKHGITARHCGSNLHSSSNSTTICPCASPTSWNISYAFANNCAMHSSLLKHTEQAPALAAT